MVFISVWLKLVVNKYFAVYQCAHAWQIEYLAETNFVKNFGRAKQILSLQCVRTHNELVAWLISREINCTNGPQNRYVYMQTSSLASNRSTHFGIWKQTVITNLPATNSIVNTDKGTQVFSCDQLCQRMNESRAKIKYCMLVSFLDWKYSRLQCSVKKEHVLIGGQKLQVCLSEYTVTDHGSTLVVNKFYACTKLVTIIFKC